MGDDRDNPDGARLRLDRRRARAGAGYIRANSCAGAASMRRIALRTGIMALGTVLALTSAWVLAQDDPESLLPPGFDRPAPKVAPNRPPAPGPAPAPSAAIRDATSSAAAPVVQQSPGAGAPALAPGAGAIAPAIKLPPVAVLEKMSPDEIDALLAQAQIRYSPRCTPVHAASRHSCRGGRRAS